LQYVAVSCSVVQFVAVCCGVLHCVLPPRVGSRTRMKVPVFKSGAVRCSALQCVAVYVAMCCSVSSVSSGLQCMLQCLLLVESAASIAVCPVCCSVCCSVQSVAVYVAVYVVAWNQQPQ